MLLRIALTLLILTLTASCAPRLSPLQELTWDAFKACQSEGPSTKLETVREDGGWLVAGREGEVFKVGNCMEAYQRKARLEGRTPPVPPALTIKPAPSPADGLVVPTAPIWSTGDAWRYSSSGASGRRSTFTWRVDREESVGDVLYYVLKSGTAEQFYRKSDLAFFQDFRRGALDRRNTPPEVYFVWPLAVSASWKQTYRYERPAANRSYDTTYAAAVEAEETVTVPAGTFKTLKIVYRNPSTKAVRWEQWYSPDVRMWVRMHEPALAEGERTRELLSFTPAGKVAEGR